MNLERLVSLFAELKKRKVFTTAAIYLPSAWLIAEILIFLTDRMGAGAWAGDVIAVLLVLGFPVALLLSWTFDVTRDGVKRASPGTPLGIIVLLASGLFLSTSAYIAYQVFSGRASEISIVILPLRTDPSMPTAQPYGLGIADSLRSAMQQLPLFRVPARTSSEAIAGAGLDIPEIAEKLDVQYVLEGSLQMLGENLNVSVTLVEKSGEVQWSERFQRATRDIFDLQNDLVRAVALELGLDESDNRLQQQIRKPAPTQDLEAHRLYLQGKYLELLPGGSMVNSEAMEALKAARKRDPGYAEIYSAMAFLYAFDCWLGEDRFGSFCTMAINHANQALQLDPGQGDALTTLAFVHSLRYEYHEAQSAIDRFVALPNQTLSNSSLPWAYENLGRLQLAWDSAVQFYNDDPLNWWAVGNLGHWAYLFKKDDAMVQHYENMMIEMTGFSVLSMYPGARAHRLDESTAIRDMAGIAPTLGVPPELAQEYAETYVRPIYDPSLRPNAVRKLRTWYEHGDIKPQVFWESLITMMQTDEAIEMAFELYDQKMLNPVNFFIGEPGRKEFRSHPRFIELVEYIGLAAYWDDVGWPLPCEMRGDEWFCGLDWKVD